MVALVPRAFGHNAIVTVDEAYHWFDRVNIFLGAVVRGHFADTNIIGHPGVTTMWLGTLGTLLRDALAVWGAPRRMDRRSIASWCDCRLPL